MEGNNRQTDLMRRARENSTINTEALTNIIHGGADNVRLKRAAWTRVENMLGTSDTSKLPIQYACTSREDLYREGLSLGKAAWDDMLDHNHTLFDAITPRYNLSNYSPLGITGVLIKPTLRQMATPEQQNKWLVPTNEGRINWAYVQTELGHGTFVRGIETTATFNQESDTFSINSPTLTSTKYWPGSLAFSSTHAVVMARLVVSGKNYGTHAFVVEIRHADGRVAEGVELGDVGPMGSYNQNDNGYAVFRQVSIPRENMLMAHAEVSRQGVYSKTGHEKSSYATMMSGRVVVSQAAMYQLAQAATIAIRYSTARQQGFPAFGDESAAGEVPLIYFRSQHYRLLTSVANAYAMLFASRRCASTQADLERRVKADDYSTATGAHALLAGMKAWITATAFDGVSDARKACGGHGYLAMSGLPDILNAVDALCTLEGDNIVMLQQTARYLIKMAQLPRELLPDDLQYLGEFGRQSERQDADILSPDIKLLLFGKRAALQLGKAHCALLTSEKAGKSKAESWNEHIMLLLSAARTHVGYIVLREFHEAIQTTTSSACHKILTQIYELFALTQMASPFCADAALFLELALITTDQLNIIRDRVNVLLKELLPEAIALTDAWDFSDGSLASAIGMKDGNVYERLMHWTRQLPTNVKAAQNGGGDQRNWDEFIRPALRSKL